MIKWLTIGLIIWYFYNRFTKRRITGRRHDPRYIRDDGMDDDSRPRASESTHEDDYIDYEEVR